jgi:hypothetical protein
LQVQPRQEVAAPPTSFPPFRQFATMSGRWADRPPPQYENDMPCAPTHPRDPGRNASDPGPTLRSNARHKRRTLWFRTVETPDVRPQEEAASPIAGRPLPAWGRFSLSLSRHPSVKPKRSGETNEMKHKTRPAAYPRHRPDGPAPCSSVPASHRGPSRRSREQ